MKPSQINSVARVDFFMVGTVVGAEIYGKGPVRWVAGGLLEESAPRLFPGHAARYRSRDASRGRR